MNADRLGARTSVLTGPDSRSPAPYYTKGTELWTLYWRDRNLKYHRYDPLDPSRRVQDLLDSSMTEQTPSSGDDDRLTWSN